MSCGITDPLSCVAGINNFFQNIGGISSLLSSLVSGLWGVISSIFVILSTLVNVMFIFFQTVEILYTVITDPGLLIMVILSCINFYAAAAGTRKEVVGRYLEGFSKAGRALVWFIQKVTEMVMWLIEAIIDII